MYRISVYGKGGIGKSTISANISYGISSRGLKVLHVGCDPKHDSTRLLTGGVNQITFMDCLTDQKDTDPVESGSNGISCVECGGAFPGIGCAGKGMIRLFDYLDEHTPDDVDIRIHDVLGDVVCGGFSVPMRKENTDAVILVVSEEFMSLYAANNILRGIKNLNDTPCILGLIVNSRAPELSANVREFSIATGLEIIGSISKDAVFSKAEIIGSTVLELFPESESASELNEIVEAVINASEGYAELKSPQPISEEAMRDIASGKPARKEISSEKETVCNFDAYDCERGITYKGNYVMPSCTSHGAVELLQGISDAAVVLHGPRNCAYLMEYANRRRSLKLPSVEGKLNSCNIFCTEMNDDLTFSGDLECLNSTVDKVISQGYKTVFLVPTCTPVEIGADLERAAKRLCRDDVQVIAVPEDDVFLGSKFGCYTGALKCMASLIDQDKDVIPNTVNILCYSSPMLSRLENIREIYRILESSGLNVNTVINEKASLDSIKKLHTAEYNIQIGDSQLNNKMSEILLRGKDCRMLKMPNGMHGIRTWIDALSKMTDRPDAGKDYLLCAEDRYYRFMEKMKENTEGLSAMLYLMPEHDVDWQIDTLLDMSIDVKRIAHWKGTTSDKNFKRSRHENIQHNYDVSLCGLKDLIDEIKPDLIITSDSRVGRLGIRWIGFNTGYTGVSGALRWARRVRNSLKIPMNDGWRIDL